jgi:hypothetical protein
MMSSLRRRTNAELLLALDTLLDSASQILMRNPSLTEEKRKLVAWKLRRALAATRVLMARFGADKQVNLKRCCNKDELPWECPRGSGARSIIRKNWKAYVRQRQLRKIKPLLSFSPLLD